MIAHSGPKGQKKGYYILDVTHTYVVVINYFTNPSRNALVFYHHINLDGYNADNPQNYYLNTGKTKAFYAELKTMLLMFVIAAYIDNYGFNVKGVVK